MFSYVLRKLAYMPLTLFGVIAITFILFFMVTSPESLARQRLGPKASQLQVYEWMETEGYLTWTDAGNKKRATASEAKTPPEFLAGEDY